MADFSDRVNDDLIRRLTEATVHVITFAPLTTQIFQVLDLTLYGVLKKRGRYKLPSENDTAKVKVIMKVYHDFGQTMVSPNAWGAFQAL
jgi:hypothetical protein